MRSEVSLSLDDLIDRLPQLFAYLRRGFGMELQPLLQGSPTLASMNSQRL